MAIVITNGEYYIYLNEQGKHRKTKDIEDIAADEQDYLDNIPENLQGSERYEAGEEAVENLEAAIDWLDDIKTSELEELLEDAKG